MIILKMSTIPAEIVTPENEIIDSSESTIIMKHGDCTPPEEWVCF